MCDTLKDIKRRYDTLSYIGQVDWYRGQVI